MEDGLPSMVQESETQSKGKLRSTVMAFFRTWHWLSGGVSVSGQSSGLWTTRETN